MDYLSFWHVGTGVITADNLPVHVYARRTVPISVNHSSNFALVVLNHQQPDLSGILAFFLSFVLSVIAFQTYIVITAAV